MNVQLSKVLSKLLLLLGTNILEVLASEDNNSSLGNQKSKLIFLLIAQLAELQPFDLSSNARGKFCDCGTRSEEMRLGLFGESALVREVKGLGCWKDSGVIIHWEIGIVFVLFREAG